MKAGDRVYLIVHAYHHYLAEVVEVLGVRRGHFTDMVKIHSSDRNWTDFFALGVSKGTKYDVIGEGLDISYIAAFRWDHDLPRSKT